MAEAYELDDDGTERCIELLGLRDDRVRDLIQEIEHLHAAAEHRSVIEQAKGTIMSAPDAATKQPSPCWSRSRRRRPQGREIAAEIMALRRRSSTCAAG